MYIFSYRLYACIIELVDWENPKEASKHLLLGLVDSGKTWDWVL